MVLPLFLLDENLLRGVRHMPVQLEPITKEDQVWRPINTAPKDGYFLVWCPDEKIGGLIEHWSARNFHDAQMREQWAHLGIPTHWMPIPEAPTP
jgi:hypothetical protein